MARGVARLAKLLELSRPCFDRGTTGLFLKGRRADDEIMEARRAWTFDLRAHSSITEPDGKILEIRDLERLGR
jgi:16S rRNA (guanine527-N7)-methyltransferase